MFREIDIKEIAEYKNIFDLFEESALAVASSPKGENVLTIAWGALGTLFSKPCCTIYINKQRYSKVIFDDALYFSVCFFNKEHQQEIDNYYGKLSGRNVDKIHEGIYTEDKIDNIPIFKEAELIILCKMMAKSDFDVDRIHEPRIEKWYRTSGVHTIYHGEVIKVLKKS